MARRRYRYLREANRREDEPLSDHGRANGVVRVRKRHQAQQPETVPDGEKLHIGARVQHERLDVPAPSRGDGCRRRVRSAIAVDRGGPVRVRLHLPQAGVPESEGPKGRVPLRAGHLGAENCGTVAQCQLAYRG